MPEPSRGPGKDAARRVAILAEGQFARATAKTAIGVLRYAPFTVVAVVDSTRAGKDAAECVGEGRGVPVISSVEEAIARDAECDGFVCKPYELAVLVGALETVMRRGRPALGAPDTREEPRVQAD